MSAVAAETSAPSGQAALVIPPAADGIGGTTVAPAATIAQDTKPSASILGSVDSQKPVEKKVDGEQGTQSGESKDGKPASAVELEIKLPEGVKADAAVLAEFKAAAKDAGLNSEQASKIAAWEVQRQTKAAEANVQAWDKQGEAWAKELDADPDFGGAKLPQTVLDAKKVLRRYGGEGVAADLAKLGLGNLPSLVKMLARIGQATKEDSSGIGGSSAAPTVPDQQTQLRQRYPSMFNADGSPKK